MRFQVVGGWLFGASLVLAPGRSGAAELSFRAPAECERAESVREQIERLIGRPLTEAQDADFDLSVERTGRNAWRAMVRTTPRDADASPSEREFTGKTCAEVGDAAAVAIAMTIEQHERDVADATTTSERPPEREVPSARAPSAPPALAQSPTPKSARFRARVGLQGALETGALPNPSLGAELDLSAGLGSFHAMLLGALLAPQTERLADGKGGEFQLLVVGLLACGERSLGPLNGLGCLGFEFGQLAAEGVGVQHPRIGNAAWRAARVDLGVAWPLGAGFSLTVRAALAAPLTRQNFVLDRTERIFRPSSLSARGLLGLELEI